MSENNDLFTQEQVDEIVKQRLSREKAKYDDLHRQLSTLEQANTDYQKKIGELEEGIKELPALRRKELLREVAGEKNIPEKFLNRLQGDTKEELLKDADSLLEVLNETNNESYKGIPRTPSGGGEPRKTGFDAIIQKVQETPFTR